MLYCWHWLAPQSLLIASKHASSCKANVHTSTRGMYTHVTLPTFWNPNRMKGSMQTHTCSRSSDRRKHTHACTCMHTYTHTHTHMYTYPRAHRFTCTHTHSRYTDSLCSSKSSFFFLSSSISPKRCALPFCICLMYSVALFSMCARDTCRHTNKTHQGTYQPRPHNVKAIFPRLLSAQRRDAIA